MGGESLNELPPPVSVPDAEPPSRALSRAALSRRAEEVAPELLGALVVAEGASGRVAVRLTEVEAYGGAGDPGSHAYRGPTPRNAVMFGPPGHAYVYFTYGMHWCLNVVCGPLGEAAGVLLRAGEVVEGLEVARSRRTPTRPERDLARGPARLCRALGVDGSCNGVDLLAPGGRLRLLPGSPLDRRQVVMGPRVGVGGAGASTPWRFHVAGDPTVSAYRPHAPRSRAAGGPTTRVDEGR